MTTHGKRHAKQDIMDAAWKLFTEQGYDETTIAQIIELSGNSRSTFYHHFRGKDELLFSLAYSYDSDYDSWLQTCDRTLPAADLLLHGFQAAFDAAVGEAGGRGAGLQFGVLVVGPGRAHGDALQERQRIVDTALHVEAVLHHVDAHVMLVAAFLFIAVVVAVVVVVINGVMRRKTKL